MYEQIPIAMLPQIGAIRWHPRIWGAWVAVGRGICVGKGIGGLDYRELLANRISGLIKLHHAHLPT